MENSERLYKFEKTTRPLQTYLFYVCAIFLGVYFCAPVSENIILEREAFKSLVTENGIFFAFSQYPLALYFFVMGFLTISFSITGILFSNLEGRIGLGFKVITSAVIMLIATPALFFLIQVDVNYLVLLLCCAVAIMGGLLMKSTIDDEYALRAEE